MVINNNRWTEEKALAVSFRLPENKLDWLVARKTLAEWSTPKLEQLCEKHLGSETPPTERSKEDVLKLAKMIVEAHIEAAELSDKHSLSSPARSYSNQPTIGTFSFPQVISILLSTLI